MESKKNSRSNLENFSKMFLLLGLVLALFISYSSIEIKSKEEATKVYNDESSKSIKEEEIPETEQKMEETKPENLPPPPPVLEEIKVVEDDKKIIEVAVQSTETNEKQKIEVHEIKEVEVVEEVVEDVPFSIIEDKPQYPGCKGGKEEQAKCLEDKIREFVGSKFNQEIASDLGLEGKQRIFVEFLIDKNGDITNIRAKAPHKRLEAEAVRVVGLLPKMTPGKQRGKPTGVKYTLPVTFAIE